MNDIIQISTDKSKLDLQYIHGFLKEQYWAKGIPVQIVEKSVEHSFCFGIYKNQKQIGFARVITDFTIFAYLADVFIDPREQRKGYAKQLLHKILSHNDLKSIVRWRLATKDAQNLYKAAGFAQIATPSHHMEKACDGWRGSR